MDLLPYAALLVGALLTFAGGKLVRGGLIACGCIAGSLAGLLAVPAFDGLHLFSFPGAWVLPIVGGLVGGALALALFRFAVASGAGVIFAGLGAAVGLGVFMFQGGQLPHPADLSPPAALVSDALSPVPAHSPLGDAASAAWESLPPEARPMLGLGILAGAVSGLVVGSLFPRQTAGVVTALIGAACVLGGGLVVADRLGVSHPPVTLLGWLCGWAGLGLLGAGAQTWPRHRTPAVATTPA